MSKDELIQYYKKQLDLYDKLIKPEEGQILPMDNIIESRRNLND
mgnify:CR=1 FL=1